MNNRVIAHSLGLSVLICGCASVPTEPVSEKLDPDTATTVTTISRPIELLASSHSKDFDPFAYIAPFETNRMGARQLFLWVSTPQAEGSLKQPQVLCNGQALHLQPLTPENGAMSVHGAAGQNVTAGASADEAVKVDLSKLSLSRAPYDSPVPWGTQWYFQLPEDGLKCLADAQGIKLQASGADGIQLEFASSERKNLASLDAFTRR